MSKLYDFKAVQQLNYVEGFDPRLMLTENIDSSGNPYTSIPLAGRLLWFMLKYPNGYNHKIIRETEDYIEVEVRVFKEKPHNPDDNTNYISRAISRQYFCDWDVRSKCMPMATVYAMNNALSEAGFGPQLCDFKFFDDEALVAQESNSDGESAVKPKSVKAEKSEKLNEAKESKLQKNDKALVVHESNSSAESNVNHKPAKTGKVNETEEPEENNTQQNDEASDNGVQKEGSEEEIKSEVESADKKEMTLEEAKDVICPVGSFAGKTLGEVEIANPSFIKHIAKSDYLEDEIEVKTACIIIAAAMETKSVKNAG